MKEQNHFNSFVNAAIRILFGVIVFGLCLQSMYSTSFLGVITKEDGSLQERTLNIADSPIKHLLVFAAFIALLMLLQRSLQKVSKTKNGEALYKKAATPQLMKIMTIIVGAAGVFFILATQLRAGSDPAKIYTLAMQWREKDFSGYAEGGYLFRYPYQAGIVLFYYLLSFIFGTDNFIALQLVNVAALMLVYYLLAKLAAFYWKEDTKIQAAAYLGIALWIPIFFYITYLYGILLGMACSLGAVYLSVKYLETRKYRYMIMASLCIGIATVFKMNCLIYLIAIACFLVYDMIVTSGWKKKIQSLLFILLMAVSVQVCNQAVYRYVENLSGYETPEGEVMVSWIVMGLQETPIGPGHYSGYIGDIFVKYNYDTEKITEASIADIKKILTRMSENPIEEGIPFFARKSAFQWNDPTFTAMRLNDKRNSAIQMPALIQSMINGRGSVVLSVWFNIMQTGILLGVLCYLILHRHSKNIYELFGGVIFIGGYLFHFVWESASSYTIPYFVIIIPYAVKGCLDLAGCCNEKLEKMAKEKEQGQTKQTEEGNKLQQAAWIKKHWITGIGLLALVVLYAAFTRTNLFHHTIALDDGEAARRQFYHIEEAEEKQKELQNGYYYVTPYLGKEYYLAEQEGQLVTAQTAPEIAFAAKGNQWTLRFRNLEQLLAIYPEDNRLGFYMDDSMNMFYDASVKAKAEWTLIPAGEDCYYLVMDNLALSYDVENKIVLLEEYAQKESQKWWIGE